MAKAAKKTVQEAASSSEWVAYRITAKVDGFRRAGIVHAGTREYRADELSEAQLALIEAEPLLILERLELPETIKDEDENKASSENQEGEVS